MVQAPLFRSGQAFGGLLTHLRLDRTRNVVNEKPLRIGPSLPPQKTHMEITAIIQAGPGYFKPISVAEAGWWCCSEWARKLQRPLMISE